MAVNPPRADSSASSRKLMNNPGIGLPIFVDDTRTDPMGAQTVRCVSQEEEILAVTAHSGAQFVNSVPVQFVHAFGFCPGSVCRVKADE